MSVIDSATLNLGLGIVGFAVIIGFGVIVVALMGKSAHDSAHQKAPTLD